MSTAAWVAVLLIVWMVLSLAIALFLGALIARAERAARAARAREARPPDKPPEGEVPPGNGTPLDGPSG